MRPYPSNVISLRALLASADGRQILRASASGVDPQIVAADAVAQLYAQGAEAVLAALRA